MFSDVWLWSFVIFMLAGLAALMVAAPSSLSLASSVATLFAAQAPAPAANGVPAPVLAVAQSLAPAGAHCQVVRGFALLEAYVGPSIVGECLENEWFNVATDQAEQRTAGGLLVWRKAESLLAFTDGYRTWIKAPDGVYQRLNTQRFCWERDADQRGCERSARPR